METAELALTLCILLAAALYSSVGHGGGSGYLASMALFGVAPDAMKPAALALNVLVAAIATFRFQRAGAFDRRLFLPLAAASVPLAFFGGLWSLPERGYQVLVAVALAAAAVRLALPSEVGDRDPILPPVWQALALGAGIGLLSGLTGVGGGIYLTPIMLLAGWARPRDAAGVSAAFILVNSVAGLAGRWQTAPALPDQLPYWAVAALLGGVAGSTIGVRRLGSTGLKRVLAVVLVVAALKLAFT